VFKKNRLVYGISPVMKTGSLGFASPGSTGFERRGVGVSVGVGIVVGVTIWEMSVKKLQLKRITMKKTIK
jgi:hypothetical protein